MRTTFSLDSGFSNILYGKKQKPRCNRNQEKALQIKKYPVLTVTTTRKLLKSHQFVI